MNDNPPNYANISKNLQGNPPAYPFASTSSQHVENSPVTVPVTNYPHLNPNLSNYPHDTSAMITDVKKVKKK
jgi:hypothetical protein